MDGMVIASLGRSPMKIATRAELSLFDSAGGIVIWPSLRLVDFQRLHPSFNEFGLVNQDLFLEKQQ